MEIKIRKYIGLKAYWKFEIVAKNGTTILVSNAYASRRNARDAAKLLKAQLGKAQIVGAA